MTQFNEDTLSEKPAIEQLKRMGYLFIPREQLDPQETEDSERLRSLIQLKEDEAKKDANARKYGLAGSKEFAFFGLIRKYQDEIPLKTEEKMSSLAKDIIRIIEERAVVEWTERDDIQKEMRREVKRLLRLKGCKDKDLQHVTTEFMEIAKRWVKR